MMDEWNDWDAIADAFGDACADVVEQTATDGMINVQNQIMSNGQIITGYMLGSVYKRTFTYSTYGQTVGTPKGKYLLPEVEHPEDRYESYFAVGAWYAWFPNYGTRFQAAHPFFEPAVDQTRPEFERRLSEIESWLARVRH